MNHSSSALDCRRMDLSRPLLIFGGLLLTATVVCGAMEASSTVITGLIVEDEVKALRNENAIGPDEADIVAMSCEDEKNSLQFRSASCRSNGTKPSVH